MEELLVALESAVYALLIAGLGYGTNWLRVHAKGKVQEALASLLGWAVSTAVTATHQTYVDAIKKAREDGKLTVSEQKHAMYLTIEKVKALMGFKGLKAMIAAYGVESIDDVLENLVEADIAEKKELDAIIAKENPQKG